MLARILFKIIWLSSMKRCIPLGLESNYILQTKVGNLKFKFQQHIRNLRRPSKDCDNSLTLVAAKVQRVLKRRVMSAAL